MSDFLDKALKIEDFIITLRRRLHEIPELGYREFKTSAFIQSELNGMGLLHARKIAKTGICLTINNGAGPTVLLRADMDGLPITEETDLVFSSKHNGQMHACGHDAHVAMLLGAIKILKDESFEGTIKFLFQPSEEGNYDDPDGFSGARRAIEEGLLEGVDCAIAMHQVPDIPTGSIAIDCGTVMASADSFELHIQGKKAHAGANPEAGIDAIIIASELITSLQNIVSRQTGAKETLVLSVSTFNAGTASNVVADEATLTGTVRTLDQSTRENTIKLITAKCDAFSKMYNTKIRFKIVHSTPTTVNSKDVTDIVHRSATKVFGDLKVLKGINTMAGEDFGSISQVVPSCFALLGTMPNDGSVYSLHNGKMTVNESALYLGTAYLVEAALDLLHHFK
ncbi:M20 metallopeptidase family protein [Vibrio mediterranei]|uniref:M20 metallopeptidase family protein n=1 Tax=Vibrio mediterranei TaxID=689 RepID=UPI00148B4215|nr:M20 family metallopeptidase [Vibrio mediterranei]NOI26379.1 amidohydrolase [Vibrio mediterranei]